MTDPKSSSDAKTNLLKLSCKTCNKRVVNFIRQCPLCMSIDVVNRVVRVKRTKRRLSRWEKEFEGLG